MDKEEAFEVAAVNIEQEGIRQEREYEHVANRIYPIFGAKELGAKENHSGYKDREEQIERNIQREEGEQPGLKVCEGIVVAWKGAVREIGVEANQSCRGIKKIAKACPGEVQERIFRIRLPKVNSVVVIIKPTQGEAEDNDRANQVDLPVSPGGR